MKFRLLLIPFFLFYSWASLHAEIKVIPEREYFDIVRQELNNAKESIEVTMFLIRLGDDSPRVKRLLDDLIMARERGVKVEVTIEDKRDNEKAYEYLKEKVSVRFDSPEIKTHCKKILIDGRKLIVGSSNWTESAFGKNHESNVLVDLIEDKDKILLLEGGDYFNNLMEVLKSCEESLDIVMYLFLLKKGDSDDPAQHIINELVNLHRKGVRIRILLDSWEEQPWGQNEAIKPILGLEGISVYYDRGDIATHNKLIISDGEKVLLGSTNWTKSALEKNIESSIFIDDLEIARIFSDHFNSFLEDIPEIDLNVQYFPLPVYFIKKGGPVHWLVSRRAEYNLRLYLWLIWKAFQDKSVRIVIQKEKWYDLISGKVSQPGKYKRAMIGDYLDLLGKKALIRREEGSLILLNPEMPDLEWSFPEEDYFSVPGELMDYHWFKKISSRALHVYFINLAEFKTSSCKPYWFDSQTRLAKRYGRSERTLVRAFKELMAFNLVEIVHDIPDPGEPYWERKANRYLINPIISPDEMTLRWKRLEERHGELYYKARALASSINEPEDPKVVASLIMLAKIYGEEAVEETIDKVKRYRFEGGRWEMRYIAGILQKDYKPE